MYQRPDRTGGKRLITRLSTSLGILIVAALVIGTNNDLVSNNAVAVTTIKQGVALSPPDFTQPQKQQFKGRALLHLHLVGAGGYIRHNHTFDIRWPAARNTELAVSLNTPSPMDVSLKLHNLEWVATARGTQPELHLNAGWTTRNTMGMPTTLASYSRKVTGAGIISSTHFPDVVSERSWWSLAMKPENVSREFLLMTIDCIENDTVLSDYPMANYHQERLVPVLDQAAYIKEKRHYGPVPTVFRPPLFRLLLHFQRPLVLILLAIGLITASSRQRARTSVLATIAAIALLVAVDRVNTRYYLDIAVDTTRTNVERLTAFRTAAQSFFHRDHLQSAFLAISDAAQHHDWLLDEMARMLGERLDPLLPLAVTRPSPWPLRLLPVGTVQQQQRLSDWANARAYRAWSQPLRMICFAIPPNTFTPCQRLYLVRYDGGQQVHSHAELSTQVNITAIYPDEDRVAVTLTIDGESHTLRFAPERLEYLIFSFNFHQDEGMLLINNMIRDASPAQP